MELDVEHILNWSEHLFNPHGWWQTQYQAQNASFTERYGAGIRSARTIMLPGRYAGRTMTMTGDALALLRRIFGPREEASPLPPPLPTTTPRQERNRRRFLRG